MESNPKNKQKELIKAAMQPQIATASSTIAQMQAISKAMQPTLKIMEFLRVSIMPIMPSLKIIESWQKSFIPIFDKIDFKELEKVIDGLEKSQEMKTPAFEKFIKEWGWLVNQKSISFGDYCYGLYKKYGDKSFKNKINRWFYQKDNLNIVLKDIKSKFPERFNIIKEGFDYHGKRIYACSITLLLPHVEGILWDLGMKKKLVKKGYNSKKKYSRYKKHKKDHDWELQELSSKLFPKDEFHKIIIKEIFYSGPRNKILHGRNIYNKKQREISRWKSTLLILTLWRLSDEF